jgi:hypothetical protein
MKAREPLTVNVERCLSGGWRFSAMVNDRLFTMRYMDYSKREAMALFRADVKAERNRTITEKRPAHAWEYGADCLRLAAQIDPSPEMQNAIQDALALIAERTSVVIQMLDDGYRAIRY